VNGVISGKGTLFIANGDKYTGEWKDGKMHGREGGREGGRKGSTQGSGRTGRCMVGKEGGREGGRKGRLRPRPKKHFINTHLYFNKQTTI